MLKFKTNQGNRTALTIKGTVLDTVAETTLMLNRIYTALCNEDKDAGEAFRKVLVGAIKDENSPVWQDE